MARTWSCLAVTRAGLEEVCAAELRALGLSPAAPGRGRVAFEASTRDLYRSVVWLRTATRVLVRTAQFPARDFKALEAGVRAVDWSQFVPAGTPVSVDVRSRRSRLYHTDAVAQRTQLWVSQAVGPPPKRDVPAPLRLTVRLVNDLATVGVDATGEPADRRGWRLAGAKAPLAPTVAAAGLLAAGYDGTQELLDPLCGSGTIAVEAALLAADRPPAPDRDWAVTRWPAFQPGTWASAQAEIRQRRRPAPSPVRGSDRDAGAVESARANVERAQAEVEVSQAPLSHAPATRLPALIATNPPWGERLPGAGDLRNLYATLGTLARRRSAGLLLYAGDRDLARATGMDLQPLLVVRSGGHALTVLHLPAGPPPEARDAAG